MKVKLDEIIDALEWVNGDTQAFLNTETGETVMWMDYGDNDIDEEELEDEKLEFERKRIPGSSVIPMGTRTNRKYEIIECPKYKG